MADFDEIMSEDPLVEMTQDVLVAIIIMALVAIVGIVGNAIYIRSLITDKKLRVDLFVIMGGLAVADIVHLSIAVPAHIIDFLEQLQVISTPWCKASRYIMSATNYIAAFHLVVMAVLRGIMLTNRGRGSPKARHCLICTGVIWAVGLMATIPVIGAQTKLTFCFYSEGVDMERELWLQASFSTFVPIAMVMFVYMTTYYVGKRYFADSYSRHEKQMSRLVSTVVIAFAVCELPYRITELVKYNVIVSEEYDRTLNLLLDYFMCLMLFDKAIRPIVYSKLSSDLGDRFDEIINCTYCHRYYSDLPKTPECSNGNSRAPLTANINGQLNVEALTEDEL